MGDMSDSTRKREVALGARRGEGPRSPIGMDVIKILKKEIKRKGEEGKFYFFLIGGDGFCLDRKSVGWI